MVDEKYFHMASEERARSRCKFWIFWNVELMKETKACSFGRNCEIIGTHTMIVEDQLHSTIIYNQSFK
jgi:hypothetical protein